ncbi:MAG: hypothetical protein IPK67_10255 [Planctomycetes bacterium]|nr:hypothetical protein [Planctomycetota bacterium]
MRIHAKHLLSCLAGLVVALSSAACQSPVQNRNPVGEEFPAVVGESLDRREWRLPTALAGRPAVVLVGYAQDAQFDADRWLYGLLQAELPLRILELPTLPGIFPSVFSSKIDSGMRSGIPAEDWGSVVTVYDSQAERLVNFTGNTSPRNIRVLLLDAAGRVLWFHDRGFSAGKLLELQRALPRD